MNMTEVGRIYNLVYNKIDQMIKVNTTDEINILLNCDFKHEYGTNNEIMTIYLNLSTRIIKCNIKNNECIINNPMDLCDAITSMYLSYLSNLDINELKENVNKYTKFKDYYMTYKYNTTFNNNFHLAYVDEK